VRAYALRRATPEVAQDVVADTFLVAWRRLDDVPEDSLPWLYAAARRVLANQRRSAARGVALAERLSGAVSSGGSADLGDSVADADLVRIALGRLSDLSREALMLVAWEGLDRARAAHAAGCSRTAFAVRVHRARAQLARELASLEAPHLPSPEPRSLEANS
jgi:DNA-directed RNA polymerase specialized sigma24 family protein